MGAQTGYLLPIYGTFLLNNGINPSFLCAALSKNGLVTGRKKAIKRIILA